MHFERVNYKAFEHDMMQYRPILFLGGSTREAYDKIELPERKTKYSCGYDVRTPVSILIAPGCSVVVPTGIKVVMSEDEMETWCLKLYARSGIGIKDKVVRPRGMMPEHESAKLCLRFTARLAMIRLLVSVLGA